MHTRTLRTFIQTVAATSLVLLATSNTFAQNPWADAVVSYEAGADVDPAYTNPDTTLGEPSRMTGSGSWVGAVTPFNAPWMSDQLVSVGAGGHLTVSFDEPITNDPAHAFGADLIIFGNAFFGDASWPDGQVSGLFEDGPFTISVSADGTSFTPLAETFNDGLFPTLGYQDLTGPYDANPGSVPSDFTKPVDPGLTMTDFDDRSFDDIVALYDGSGGGIPVDIASAGLDEVFYVRIDVPAGATSPEFDAFATVPEPAALLLFGSIALFGALRRGR